MLLTDQFVYLHVPKTGGTFVTSVLERLYEGRSSLTKRTISRTRGTRLGARGYKRLVEKGAFGYLNVSKHGNCRAIPESHRDKPVIACIRNPFDRQVSQFEFRWWERHPHMLGDLAEIRRLMPHFPDLSFDDYMTLVRKKNAPDMENPELPGQVSVGVQTRQFVDMFFPEPEKVLRQLDDQYIERSGWEQDMIDVRFIHTENLNRELHDTLVDFGFDPEELGFLLESGKVLPRGNVRKPEQNWERYYSPEQRERFQRSERLLFAMFPEYADEPGE